MPRSITFAHYLMGHAPFRRAPFFYTYAVMWLHLLIGTGLLALSGAHDWLSIFAALVVISFCAGLVLYGLLTDTRRLLINIGSYAAGIAHVFSTDPVVLTCFIAGLIAALASSYSILAAEYDRYQREVHRQPVPLPTSVAVLLGAAIVLLGVYGLLAS